jgi:hypothetical protein
MDNVLIYLKETAYILLEASQRYSGAMAQKLVNTPDCTIVSFRLIYNILFGLSSGLKTQK